MSEIVNLRRARKRKARETAEHEAAQQRAKFGRTKTETSLESQRRARDARLLDGHALSRPNEP